LVKSSDSLLAAVMVPQWVAVSVWVLAASLAPKWYGASGNVASWLLGVLGLVWLLGALGPVFLASGWQATEQP
jgi:hypothetical protein